MAGYRRLKTCFFCVTGGFVLFLFWLAVPVLADQKTPFVKAEETNASVRLNTEERVVIESGEPGFILQVQGWEPNGTFVVYAVDSDGKQLPIIPEKHAKRTSAEGASTISIPYRMRGLHPGQWMFLVFGAPGAHAISVVIPKVVPPGEKGGTWQLDFRAGDEHEKKGQGGKR